MIALKTKKMKLIKNKAQCLNCEDSIESKTRHDFVSCNCFQNKENGNGIFIDGGLDYQRYGGNLKHFKNLSKYE